ncbi:MAG: cheA2, partial [Clostridiales bacterium]|nr:cheA2 [Clostridiales bacterium]
DDTIQVIRKEGFKIFVKADKAYDEMHEFFNNTVFLKGFELIQLENDEDFNQFHTLTNLRLEKDSIKIPRVRGQEESESVEKEAQTSAIQSIISVNVSKLDKLMDLVGEMVIAEAMVT